MINIIRKLQRVQPAAMRHLLAHNIRPYTRILQSICAQEEIWNTTQGDYMKWWRERETMRFSVHVAAGQCQVLAASPRAEIELYQGPMTEHEFLEETTVACPQSDFSGECVITIDPTMQHQATLIEFLRREGVLNYRVGQPGEEGDFFLAAAELDPLLAPVYERMMQHIDQPVPTDVAAVMEIVRQKLAQRGLPLLRVWYHPRINGRVMMAVFSPRYDVDRAISNMARIRRLERRFGVESTFYIRAFCPFYADADVEELASKPWCPEIALHGEFLTNSRVYGDEFRAAVAERAHLERTAGVRVEGVGMHGGELTKNRTATTSAVTAATALHYDTTPRPYYGNYLPSRRLVNGKFSNTFGLPHSLSDVEIDVNAHYGKTFYTATMQMMREIREANGVFVLMVHPEYFGFFSYLARPANLRALLHYMMGYIRGRQSSEVTA